ncbi:hypothetical protein [Acinetobacter guerrae]|uniref:hypothetical protein n=1 Tax=Acinetobacter guerrae TaxID=1843371 RepID=UPI00128E17A6|nr:hypothetical protein [Acinetobacter guerrae]MPW44093.1 hypothetical protein [Acinetobacter guerrae]
MTKIISPDNTELLVQILGDIQNKAYIDVVCDVQQQVSELPQLELPVFHHFAPNVYMRQMDAPAGTLMVTKMHKTEHFLIILKGSATIQSADGMSQVYAPQIIKTMPGTKRVIYFHEDSSWLTVHPTESTNLLEIENQMIVPDNQIQNFLKSLEDKGDLQ